MSENPKVPTFESAERKFLIDSESGYFKALAFAKDPVSYYVAFRQSLLDDGFSESDLGIQAMGELAELEQIILNENMSVLDERANQMMDAEYNTEAWAQVVFPILKEAGFTKEQLRSWFELSDDELTAEEKLNERTMMVYLNKIYGQV